MRHSQPAKQSPFTIQIELHGVNLLNDSAGEYLREPISPRQGITAVPQNICAAGLKSERMALF